MRLPLYSKRLLATRGTAARIVRSAADSPTAVAFAVAIATFFAIALLQGEKPFYYDASVYWSLADTFTRDGSFSLLNFENMGLRGYALPLAFHMLKGLAGTVTDNASLMVMAFNAVVFALIGTVLAPRLAQIAWPELRWSVSRRLALSAVLLVFWRGYLNFPLSDFPALAAMLLALIAVSSSDSPRWMLVAGASAALAVNFRPAYLLLVPILVGLVLWDWFDQRGQRHVSWMRRAACLGLFAAGLVVVSLPQSLSQHEQFGSYNPIPGGGDLAGLQYTEGLRLQRYETYVGGTSEQVRMTYFDNRTTDILAGLEGGAVSGTGQYIEIALEHPLTIAGVFLRHVINGLDQRYTTPYVERLQDRSNRILRGAGFLIVFLAIARLAWPAARRRLEPARWRYPAALLLASATVLPSAVETRFMLPVFVLSGMIVLAPGWISPIGPAAMGLRRYRTLAILLAAAILFYLGVGTVVTDATENLQLTPE